MVEVLQHNLPVSRTTVETDRKVETREFKTGKPVAYTSTEPVYVGGTLFKAGEPFVTGDPKGATWNFADPKEKAAAEAASQHPGDIDLDALDVAALKAFAATKGVNLGDAKSKADIITVIKAANEPTL